MSEEQVEPQPKEVVVDADRDEEVEALTFEQRQEALKQSRWNVFLWLGIAVLMFGFALFPMSFDESYDGFTNSAEKDIGWVWGPPCRVKISWMSRYRLMQRCKIRLLPQMFTLQLMF